MADITANAKVFEQETGVTPIANSPYALKEIVVTTPNTADTADTLDVVLATYGITNVKYVKGYVHNTEDSVIVLEAPTTSVTTGTLTITIGGSAASNLKRVYIIGGY